VLLEDSKAKGSVGGGVLEMTLEKTVSSDRGNGGQKKKGGGLAGALFELSVP